MTRWWLALTLFAAGCGGGVRTPDVDTDKDADEEDQGTCDGNAFTLRLDTASVAAASVGFDLDGHETNDSNDPIGCGHLDAAGGVDNALYGLDSTLSGYGWGIGGPIADAIADGGVVIEITIAGYDGGPEDDCVLIDVATNGETSTTSEQGAVTGGVLEASFAEMPIRGVVDVGTGPLDADITARDVVLSLPLSAEPISVTGGILAAGLPWDEAGNDKDLRSLVQSSVDPNWFPLVEGILAGQLDLQPAGTSAECDALSATLQVDASQ